MKDFFIPLELNNASSTTTITTTQIFVKRQPLTSKQQQQKTKEARRAAQNSNVSYTYTLTDLGVSVLLISVALCKALRWQNLWQGKDIFSQSVVWNYTQFCESVTYFGTLLGLGQIGDLLSYLRDSGKSATYFVLRGLV